jgi:hypothetical protein
MIQGHRVRSEDGDFAGIRRPAEVNQEAHRSKPNEGLQLQGVQKLAGAGRSSHL